MAIDALRAGRTSLYRRVSLYRAVVAFFLQGRYMDPQHRNRYNEEFKKSAVREHLESHGTLAGSAARLGITSGMLSKWVERYSPREDGRPENSEEEIKRLKEQVRVLKEIVSKAFLKKYTVDEIVDRMIDEPEKFLTVDDIPQEKQ
jgi:transposase-like protein